MKLTAHQREVLDRFAAATKPIIWAGSIRSGKTVGAVVAFGLWALQFPGNYIIGGRTLPSAMRNVVKPMRDWADEVGVSTRLVRSASDFGARLELGSSTFYLFGGDNEASQDKVQGLTASGALLDEALLMPKSFILQAIARCSQPNARILMTLNKGSPNHWIKREWIDEGKVELMESTLDDNPNIGQSARDLYDGMFTGHHRARMLDNIWADPTGVIFNEPPEVKRMKPGRAVIGMDAALSGTTAALLFVQDSKTGVWVLRKEYYHTGERTYAEHRQRIDALAPGAPIIIDPAAARGLKRELRRSHQVNNANNDILFGIQCGQWAIECGKVALWHKGLDNFRRERSGYIWDAKKLERGEDAPVKANDHAMDAFRYFCARHLKPGVGTVRAKPKHL